MVILDPNIPNHSYFIGFVAADGHISRVSNNKGKLSIELTRTSENILILFSQMIDAYSSISYRTRNTNFKENCESVIWSVSSCGFWQQLLPFIPVGRKADKIIVPEQCSLTDYYRGYIDGNGSLGFTKDGRPFLSFGTASPLLATAYRAWADLYVTAKNKSIKPNLRDDYINLVYYAEDAVNLVAQLYYDNPKKFVLNYKNEIAQQIKNWKRPENIPRKIKGPRWTPEQDTIVKTHNLIGASAILNRSFSAIKNRYFRLGMCSKGR